MRMLLPFLLLAVTFPAYSAIVTTEAAGQIELLSGTSAYMTLLAGTFGPNWEYTPQTEAIGRNDAPSAPTRRELDAGVPIGGTRSDVTVHEVVQSTGAATLSVQYDLTVNQDTRLQALCLAFRLPCSLWGEQTITVHDRGGAVLQSATLSRKFGPTSYFKQDGAAQIRAGSGSLSYAITLDPTAAVELLDNRAWGGTDFELRLYLLSGASGPVPEGTQVSRPLTIQFARPVDFQLDPSQAFSQNDTTGWFPYVIPWDGAPLDLSSLNEKPAGKHGFLEVRNGAFAFADGTPVRFWGVCNTVAANFPTHDQSSKIAARMARFGINLVRVHQADAGWKEPNLFDESYGDTQHFDPVALDNFDYFLAQLKQQGIYIYLDQLVSRRFTAGDGVVNADQVGDMAKAYAIFDPTMIALQRKFSHDLWTHVNPYTGLAYKDDPAIAMMEFANENDLITFDVTVEPYATDLERRWSEWAAAHGVSPNQPVRIATQRTPEVLRFLDEMQRSYYADMYASMRSIGVRVPITGNTWLVSPANLPSQATMDFMDSHAYVDHPTQNGSHWTNRLMVQADPATTSNSASGMAPGRLIGKPFVVSEWNQPWPNEWRAEQPLALAAFASLQRWDGLLGYTYRHSTSTPVEALSGVWETFNDPALFGLYPAAALLFRRGDMGDAGLPTAVLWTDSDIFGNGPQFWDFARPAYRSLAERVPVVTALASPPAASVRRVVSPDEFLPTQTPTSVKSINGRLFRDWALGIGRIDTPRTQAIYGLVGSASTQHLTDVSFSIATPFATVAVSALDGMSIRGARQLLVTAVARAENTGMKYNLTHTELRDWGTGPILCEPVLGRVTIETHYRRARVSAVNADGTRRLLFDRRLRNGEPLVLDLTAAARTIYYVVVLS